MPFGLVGAPSTCQHLMNNILQSLQQYNFFSTLHCILQWNLEGGGGGGGGGGGTQHLTLVVNSSGLHEE